MVVHCDSDFEVVYSVDAMQDAPQGAAVDVDATDKVALQRLVLLFAADTTGSMGAPIVYGIQLLQACMDYLAGIASSDNLDTLEVIVHVIGMNDWQGTGGYTHPVKLFLNEQDSINAGRPIGYSFVLNKNKPDEWKDNVAVVNAAIKEMADSTRNGKTCGGDAREEYATGVHFIKTIVEQDKKDFPDAKSKYFMLSITDDMQHGMSARTGGDSWPKGVLETAVYGDQLQFAYKYACPYAPDKHSTLGFPLWKPHSFFHNLNDLLGLGVTVVWCPIGSSARHGPGTEFESWVGTLSTIFEYANGVVLSWAKEDVNKPVPATVAHLLNTLITSASISNELDVEKRREAAARQAESLMDAAKKHSQTTQGSLHQVPTTMQGAADALDELVVESGLTELLQNIFLGRAQPDDETSSAPVRAAFRSIKEAHKSGDSVSADSQIAMAYRSLSSECNAPAPPPPPPSLRVDTAAPLTGSKHALSSPVEHDPTAPVYRSLSSARGGMTDDPDEANEEPAYRSLAAGILPDPPVASLPVAPKKRCVSSSKDRLLRMACTA